MVPAEEPVEVARSLPGWIQHGFGIARLLIPV